MTGHRAIIEAGPGTIRRLCCESNGSGDERASEVIAAALGAVDDGVALVGERPMAVDVLWGAALRSASCSPARGLVVLYPSWWPAARVDVLTAAAGAVADDVAVRPRSWLLARVSAAPPEARSVVEIADRLVAVSGVRAVPRTAAASVVAAEVGRLLAEAGPPAVVIDAPAGVAGAAALASSIADAARGHGLTVERIDGGRLARLARSASARARVRRAAHPRRSRRRPRGLTALAAAAAVPAIAAPAVWSEGGRGPVTAGRVETAPATTFLVEGRVALTVPADWPTQRVTAGPGSARVQVSSPSDPEVAMHVTQSPVAGETLSGAAERLKRAIDAAPAGVFVDFNPSGASAGRPAVTYREVRPGHQVLWTVLLDGPVRISIGCQSRPGAEDAVRAVCEQAVRSAHAIG